MWLNENAPIIKGTRDGLVIQIDGSQPVSQTIHHLRERFHAAPEFFRDASASLSMAHRLLDEGELQQLFVVFADFGMTVQAVMMGEEMGEINKNDTEDEADIRQGLAADIDHLLNYERAVAMEKKPTVVHESADRDDSGEMGTKLVRRTLRSGQHVHFDGHVVVIGDVNPGAEIIAGGDILIFGAFRGVAHAGVAGREDAVVAALKLQPTQLRIANYISRPPDGRIVQPSRPEVAKIKAGKIEIEGFQTHN